MGSSQNASEEETATVSDRGLLDMVAEEKFGSCLSSLIRPLTSGQPGAAPVEIVPR